MLRSILALVVIALPIWFAAGHVAHHEGDNPFLMLHAHLNAEPLIYGHADHDEHADETSEEHAVHASKEYVLALALPDSLGFFDMDPEWVGAQLVMTNLQLFQIAAAVLLIVCLIGVPKYLRTGSGDRMSKIFAGFCLWIRDEMVYPVMGRETGGRFLPLFLFMFFFILFMNMLGLVPGSATATASIFVTCALAVVTLVAMLGCGMAAQGPIAFWKHLVPHVPAALWPLMFIVEVVGLIVKPFALTVRLFANMSGGHLVVLSFMGLIFHFTQQFGDVVGWASSPVALGFAVFIMIIEFFVAMLQAYVFTQLSILFVQASVHPDH